MIFHEEHMRTGDDSTSATLCGEGGRHPLAAGCWFITNKDYPGNGTFCPLFDCCSVRTSRALTHAFASLVGVRRGWGGGRRSLAKISVTLHYDVARYLVDKFADTFGRDTDRSRGCFSRVVMSSWFFKIREMRVRYVFRWC